MTALQDQINTALRDYITDGVPASGAYTPLISDLRTILYGMAVETQFITAIQNFSNAATVADARTAIGLGSGDAVTHASLTISGALAIDTTTLVVDAVNNRVGIGTATPSTGLQVALAASFGSTLAVTGAVTLTADLTVDTSTLKVDSANNRVGVGTATPGVVFDVVGDGRITANSSNPALRVVQTGAGYSILVEDAASTDSTPFAVDASGVVLMGHTASIAAAGITAPRLQVHGATGDDSTAIVTRWSANATSPFLLLQKSRGSAVGSRAVVSSADELGTIGFGGDDGTNFILGASIRAMVDGTAGSNDMPGRLEFRVTPDGSASLTTRLAIANNGFLSFNNDLDTGIISPGANELAFWSGGAETFRIEENGVFVVGHTDSITTYSALRPEFQLLGTTAATSQALIHRASTDNGSPILNMQKARGSLASPSLTLDGDTHGTILWTAYDGANFLNSGQIIVQNEGDSVAGNVPARMRFYVNNASGTFTERLRISAAGAVSPGVDNTQSLGGGVSSLRWTTVFATTGTINTSDAREKDWLGGLTAEEMAAANTVLTKVGTYQWKDAVAEKGPAARRHAGVTAQSIASALMVNGLEPEAYGFWCADPIPGGVRYGVRYDELAMFLIAALDARLRTLEAV